MPVNELVQFSSRTGPRNLLKFCMKFRLHGGKENTSLFFEKNIGGTERDKKPYFLVFKVFLNLLAFSSKRFVCIFCIQAELVDDH